MLSRTSRCSPPSPRAFSLLLCTGKRREVWLFLRKSHVGSGCSVCTRSETALTFAQAGWMGVVQGLALPFRGFSRSGSTISTAMLVGATKQRAERFSFAMAVVLTPAVVGLEAIRLQKAS